MSPYQVKYQSKVVTRINWWRSLFGLGPIDGITLYPNIHVWHEAGRAPATLIKHELIHIYQIERFGRFNFYFKYVLWFLWNIVRYFNFDMAYRNIPFEVEAYRLESSNLSMRAIKKRIRGY